MCYRRVYLLRITLICNNFRSLIYIYLYMYAKSFSHFCVPMNLLIQSVRFPTICNEMIFQSTSEACILFLDVRFSTINIVVVWVKGLFIMGYPFSVDYYYFSWVWSSTVTAPWSRKANLSHYFLLNYTSSNDQFASQIRVTIFISKKFLSLVFVGGLISETSISTFL